MKSRLIILSDLWGRHKSNWVSDYVALLKDNFEIQYYDCCELGGIDKIIFTEQNLHDQFANGGIEIAVQSLLNKEKGEIKILAFSVGGTIAWKAALKGLKVSDLVAVSSTRLRYETQVPNCQVQLYFGEWDEYKPDGSWFLNCQIVPEINKNNDHLMYVEKDFIHLVCDAILKQNL